MPPKAFPIGAREKEAFDYFVSQGWKPHQAAGIVGNLMSESGLKSGARNGGDGKDGTDSIGIGQWNSDRAARLKAMAAKSGVSWQDYRTQLRFVQAELRGDEAWGMEPTEGHAANLIAASTDVDGATDGAIMFERPAGSQNGPRSGHNWVGRNMNAHALLGTAPTMSAVPETAANTNVEPYNPWQANASKPNPISQPEMTPPPPAPTWGETGQALVNESTTFNFLTQGDRGLNPDIPWMNQGDKRFDGNDRFKALPSEGQDFVRSNAVSPFDADKLIEREHQVVQDGDVFAQQGLTGMGMRMGAALVDPMSLAAGVATGGAATGGILARTGIVGGRMARAAEAGIIAAGENAALAIPKMGQRSNYGVDDLLMETTAGLVIGGGVGALSKAHVNVHAPEEGARLDAQTRAMWSRVQNEAEVTAMQKRGAILTDKGLEHYGLSGNDAGAAFNPDATFEAAEGTGMSTWIDKLRIDPHKYTQATPQWAAAANALMPDPVGTGGLTPRVVESVWAQTERTSKAIQAEADRNMADSFQGWLKEGDNAKGILPGVQAWQTFEEAVFNELHLPSPTASAYVQKGALAQSNLFKRNLQEAKANGAEWAKNIPEDETYVPWIQNHEAVLAAGREKVQLVVRAAMADADNNAADAFAVRRADVTARSAGNKAASEEAKSAKPLARQVARDQADQIKADAHVDLVSAKLAARDEIDDLVDDIINQTQKDVNDFRDHAAALKLEGSKLTGEAQKLKMDEAAEINKLASLLRDSAKETYDKAAKAVRQEQKLRAVETKSIRDAAVDAATEAGEKAAQKSIKEVFAETYERMFRINSKAFREAYLDRTSKKFTDTMMRRANGNEASAGRGLSGVDADELAAQMKDAGVPDFEADLIAKAHTASPNKTGPGHFKARAPLNRQRSFDVGDGKPMSMFDFANKSMTEVSTIYTRQTQAAAAMAKNGFQSESAARKYVEDITTFDVIKREQPGISMKQAQDARKVLNYYLDRIYNKPLVDPTSTASKLTRAIGSGNFTEYMQQSGISQLGDMPKLLLKTGFRATWNHFNLNEVAQVFRRGGAGASDLAREFEIVTGVGFETGGSHSRLGTYVDMDNAMEITGNSSMLDKAVRTTQNLAKLTARTSLSSPITDFLSRTAVRAHTQRLIDHAMGVGKPLSQKHLNDWGVSLRLQKALPELVKRMDLNGKGVLVKLNVDKQAKEMGPYFNELMAVVTGAAKRTILQPQPSAIPMMFTTSNVGKLASQLKTYSMASFATNTIGNLKLGSVQAAGSLAATSLWGALVFMGHTYTKSLGMSAEEGQKYRDKMLSLSALLANGVKRSADVGIIPDLIDTPLAGIGAIAGKDFRLFKDTRNSGLASDLFTGNPTIATISSLGDAVFGSITDMARGDQHWTQQEAKKRAGTMIPFLKAYGLLQALQAMTSGLPTKEPRDTTFDPTPTP